MPARPLALLIALAAATMPTAQAAGEAGTPRVEPAVSTTRPTDCPRVARHDHGLERGTPTAMPARCAVEPARAGDEPAARPRVRKLGHDHARVHKLM
jgi:hypothetical protein